MAESLWMIRGMDIFTSMADGISQGALKETMGLFV